MGSVNGGCVVLLEGVGSTVGPVVLVDGTGQVLSECSECVHGVL